MSQLRKALLTYVMPFLTAGLFALLVTIALYRLYTQSDTIRYDIEESECIVAKK